MKGITPLYVAATWGYPELVRYLLQKQANPSRRDARGMTPLRVVLVAAQESKVCTSVAVDRQQALRFKGLRYTEVIEILEAQSLEELEANSRAVPPRKSSEEASSSKEQLDEIPRLSLTTSAASAERSKGSDAFSEAEECCKEERCRTISPESRSCQVPAAPYGQHGCNSPKRLIDLSLEAAKAQESEAVDIFPGYTVDFEQEGFYEAVAQEVRRSCDLSENAFSTLRRFGFYWEEIGEKMVLLVLNTVIYATKLANRHNSTAQDPFGQLAWLKRRLQAAQVQGYKVTVRVLTVWQRTFAVRYWNLLAKYGEVVAGQFFSHQHRRWASTGYGARGTERERERKAQPQLARAQVGGLTGRRHCRDDEDGHRATECQLLDRV
eukprot:g29925.t1